MLEQATWSVLCTDVAIKIVWSDRLQLLDKLRCQAVCKSWNALLRNGAGGTHPESLVKELDVSIVTTLTGPTQARQRTALRVHSESPTIQVFPTDQTNPSPSYCASRQWLASKANYVGSIRLSADRPEAWQLQDLLTTLQKACQRNPLAVQVKLEADPVLVDACAEGLMNTLVRLDLRNAASEGQLQHLSAMTRLTFLDLDGHEAADDADDRSLLNNCKLPQLHTLRCQAMLALTDFGDFHALRQLVVDDFFGPVCDMTSCTQLTSLDLSFWESIPEQIMLPTGSNVQLQRLEISSSSYEDRVDMHLLWNLPDAIQLTYIKFYRTHPGNLDTGWPMLMPNLKVINTCELPHGPPQQLLGYSLLRHLELANCYHMHFHVYLAQAVVLPGWLSQLTQLESLKVTGVWWSEFPLCLLQLSQLRSLDLSNNHVYDNFWDPPEQQLPAEIALLADFTALSYLDLRLPRKRGTRERVRYSESTLCLLSSLQERLHLQEMLF